MDKAFTSIQKYFLTGGNHTHGWATTFTSLGDKFSGLGYSYQI